MWCHFSLMMLFLVIIKGMIVQELLVTIFAFYLMVILEVTLGFCHAAGFIVAVCALNATFNFFVFITECVLIFFFGSFHLYFIFVPLEALNSKSLQ